MNNKKVKILIICLLAVSVIIGITARFSFKNILADNNVSQFSVAPMREELASLILEKYPAVLSDMQYILKVKAKGEVDFSDNSVRQKVIVEKVFEGTGLKVGQEIDIIRAHTALDFDTMEFDMGFINIMKKDDVYLVFLQEKINSQFKGDSQLYRLSDELIISPVFNYKFIENVITPAESGEYVSYTIVKDNEFIVENQNTEEYMLQLKELMIDKYKE